MSSNSLTTDQSEPTCIGCGFREYFDADKQLHSIQITIAGEHWPELDICDDCAQRMAADLGYAHLLPENIQQNL